jgi:multimeric flavodoxin WrbA
MSLKITLIVGSPRKNRSCNFLIDKAIEGIKSVSNEIKTNKIFITDYKITPCTGCDQCLKPPNECPFSKDDDTKKMESELFNSKGLIIAAPNYFGSVSAQIKALIDRSRPWKMAGYKLKDIIFSPMAASGLRNAGGGVTSDLINFALIQGMIIVGGLGTPTIEENLAITTLQKYKLKEFLGKDEIDELGGKIAFNQGKRVAELILGFKK